VNRNSIESLDADDHSGGQKRNDDRGQRGIGQGKEIWPPATKFQATAKESPRETQRYPIKRGVDERQQADEEE